MCSRSKIAALFACALVAASLTGRAHGQTSPRGARQTAEPMIQLVNAASLPTSDLIEHGFPGRLRVAYDCRRLATRDEEKDVIHIWNLSTGAHVKAVGDASVRLLEELAVSRDGRLVATTPGWSNEIWDVEANIPLFTLREEFAIQRATGGRYAFSSDGQVCAMARVGAISLVLPDTSDHFTIAAPADAVFHSLGFVHGTHLLAVMRQRGAEAQNDIVLLDAHTGKVERTIALEFLPVTMRLSADGARLACGGSGGELCVFDVADGRELASATARDVHMRLGFMLDISSDGRFVVAAAAVKEPTAQTFFTCNAYLFGVDDRSESLLLRADVHDVAFIDERTLAVSIRNQPIHFIDVVDKKEIFLPLGE